MEEQILTIEEVNCDGTKYQIEDTTAREGIVEVKQDVTQMQQAISDLTKQVCKNIKLTKAAL